MQKRRFPATVKAIEGDFNGIHDNTQAALRDLQNAIAGENANADLLLLKNEPPLPDTPGAGQVRVPVQPIAINGIFAEVPQTDTVDISPGIDRKVGIYFRITQSDASTVTRDFLDTAGPDPVTGSGSFVMEQETAVTVVVQDPDSTPAPVTDEVGLIKYAIMDIASNVVTVDTHDPLVLLWQFPVSVAAGSHAASHLTAGGDPIQLATPSQEGLASAADTTTTIAALTDLSSVTDYLVRTISGDNAVTPADKAVSLQLRAHTDMFQSVDQGGQQKLALKYLNPVGLAGASNTPARVDHRHNLSTSASITVLRVIPLVASDMGQLQAITMPTTMGTMTSVSIFWKASGITNFPVVEAQDHAVFLGGVGVKAGARAIFTGQQTLSIAVGAAMCEMTQAESDLVSAAAGSVTWTSYSGSGSLLPTSGSLLVYVTGLRNGVAVLT